VTEGEKDLPRFIARPIRSEAERAEWENVFRELRVEGEADREAIRAELGHWIDDYDSARWWHRDDERAGPWRTAVLQRTRELVELLKSVPFPFDVNSDVFEDGDPDVPSPALVMLSRIEKELSGEPAPRAAHRPKVDYSDLTELVRRVAPIYRAHTGRDPAAGNLKGGGAGGPFVRLMRALITIAGDQPVDHAIQKAVRAYNMNKSIGR
jgi:hypothetical protein